MSLLGPIIEEVKQLLASRVRWRVTWVRRSANNAAHLLAKDCVANNRYNVWLHEPPDCILQTVADEIPGCEI